MFVESGLCTIPGFELLKNLDHARGAPFNVIHASFAVVLTWTMRDNARHMRVPLVVDRKKFTATTHVNDFSLINSVHITHVSL